MPQIRNYAARVVDMTPAGMARLLRTDRATRLSSAAGQPGAAPSGDAYHGPGWRRSGPATAHPAADREVLLDWAARTARTGGSPAGAPARRGVLGRRRPLGFTSLIASRLVGPTGRVEAFEPFPPNVERLAGSVGLNGFTNVTVHTHAITNRDGMALFHLHESSLQGSLVEDSSASAIQVACETLDTVARRLPRPDLIKVDAEGAEFDVLEGGRQFLMTVRPRLIVEFTTPDLLDRTRQLLPSFVAAHLGQNHWLLQPE